MSGFNKRSLETNANLDVIGRNVESYFVPLGGWLKTTSPTELVDLKLLCDVVSIDSAILSAAVDRTVFSLGKETTRKISGAKIDEFTVTTLGGANNTPFFFLRKDMTNAAIDFTTIDHGKVGGFINVFYNDAGTKLCSYFVGNLSARTLSTPALAEGQITFQTTFYSDNPIVYFLQGDHTFVAEGWYAGGTITNAAAPNGTLTAFVAGTGNESLASGTVTPVIINVDGSTDYDKYTVQGLSWTVGTDPTPLNSAVWSYVTGTKSWDVPTGADAPAGTILSTVYAIKDSVDPIAPSYRPDLLDGTNDNKSGMQLIEDYS